MRTETCVVVFVKYPGPGACKTRLAADLGDEFIQPLYRLFVRDTLDMLGRTACDAVIACDPHATPEQYADWLGNGRAYITQTGDGLGDRMANALMNAFEMGYSRALLIGSDLPDLPSAWIEEAISALSESDAVIGPSEDGGYYLIGFNKQAFTREIFEGIAWSTPVVFRNTCDRMRARDLSVQILPSWRDVDTKDDLLALYERNRHTEFAQSWTMRYLDRHWEVTNGEAGL